MIGKADITPTPKKLWYFGKCTDIIPSDMQELTSSMNVEQQ